MSDPGTSTAASFNNFTHPFPRLEALIADLWDLTYRATGAKNPATYPRPWPTPTATRQHGNAAGRSPEEVKALLGKARSGLSDSPPV